MRFKNKLKIYLIWCIIFCVMMPVMQPILAYAESADVKVNVSGIETTLSVRPYINDLGLMADAREIAEAYGLQYQFDSNQKSFRITDDVRGDIVLMHNASEFYSGKNKFPCEPYFYLENTIPMIEVGFFCEMFDASYEYDEKTNTIFIEKGEIDENIAKIKINDRISSMYYEPFKGEYGLMVGAEDISKAYGLDYAFDLESKTATLSDTKHSDVILTDGTTDFQSGERVFECLPYFCVVNDVPFIEVGFFCEMYGQDYQYDEETKTLELFEKQEQVMLFAAINRGTVSGKISYTSEMVLDELQVQLVMRPYNLRTGYYSGKDYGDPHTLGTVTLTNSETEGNYQFDTSSYASEGYQYYEWYCVIPSGEAYPITSSYPQFRYITDEYADFEIAANDISGNIELNKDIVDEETNADGTEVSLILQQTAQRHRKYESSYTVLGERYTLGTVQFAQYETSKDYVYAVFPYISEEYPDYSLFFETPGIDKYGYYGVYNGTASLDIEPDYNDKSNYYTDAAKSFSFSERSKANLKIGYDENLTGSVGIDTAISIPSDGLDISFILKTAQSQRCSYYNHPYWDEGDTYPLGTVHLTQDKPKADFKFDTKQYNSSKTPYYVLFYQIEDNSSNIGGYGYVSGLDAVTEIDVMPENYHFNNITHEVYPHTGGIITDKFKPQAFLSANPANVDLTLPASLNAPYGSCGSNAQWSFNEDTGEVQITGTGTVTSLPWDKYADSIKSIIIGDGITEINKEYFHAPLNNLISITIGSSVTSIYLCGFGECCNLKEINVSENNPKYSSDNGVLLNKEKTKLIYCPKGKTGSYTVPESVTSIDSKAFSSCEDLTSIAIGSGVTSIYASDFDECSNLKEINVSADNPNYASDNGVLLNKEKTELIYCPKGKTGSYTVPDSVTSIDSDAFSGCKALTSIAIGSGVTSIYASDFDGCSNLKEINVSADNPDYTSDNGVLLNKKKTVLIYYPNGKTGSYIIPDTVTSIGRNAFSGCRGLTDIIISDSVKSIGDYAFYGCFYLSNITIGNGVTSIGRNVFNDTEYYDDLTNWNTTNYNDMALYIDSCLISVNPNINGDYQISNGTRVIADGTFSGCRGLTSVTIPDSVINIGSYAFSGCRGLTSVTIPDSVTGMGSFAFEDCSNLEEVHISDIAAWCNISYTSNRSNPLHYAQKLYLNNELVEDLTIPDSVTNIKSYAFEDCSSLTSITIGSGVKSINTSAFYGCSNLKEINVSEKNTKFAGIDGVLANKNKTNIIYCPKGKTDSYTIPDSVIHICDYAFSRCNSLTSVTIPDSVTSIGYAVFYNCSSLTEVYYCGSEEDWMRITIYPYNTKLTDATIYYNVNNSAKPAIVEISKSETDTDYIFTVTPIEVNESCHIYGAAYTENGILLECNSKELETDGTTTVTVKKTDNTKSVKAFVWTDKMQPVSIEEIEINK